MFTPPCEMRTPGCSALYLNAIIEKDVWNANKYPYVLHILLSEPVYVRDVSLFSV